MIEIFSYRSEAIKAFDEEVGIFNNLYLSLIRLLSGRKIQIQEDLPKALSDPSLTDERVKEIIFEFITNFDRMYGREGVAKILYGSKRVKRNSYNERAIDSEFFGRLNIKTTKRIIEFIDEMFAAGTLYPSRGQYALPLLSVTPPGVRVKRAYPTRRTKKQN